MNKRLADTLTGLLMALMFAIAFWAIDRLPPGAWIAVHWSAGLQPDGWIGKWAGLLFIPLVATFICFVQSAFPQADPLPGRLNLPDPARRAIFVGALLLQTLAEAAIALQSLS